MIAIMEGWKVKSADLLVETNVAAIGSYGKFIEKRLIFILAGHLGRL